MGGGYSVITIVWTPTRDDHMHVGVLQRIAREHNLSERLIQKHGKRNVRVAFRALKPRNSTNKRAIILAKFGHDCLSFLHRQKGVQRAKFTLTHHK